MVWIGGAEHIDNGLLGGTIDIRDIIAGTFAADFEPLQIHAGSVDDGAGAAGRLDGGIEHRVHVTVLLLFD